MMRALIDKIVLGDYLKGMAQLPDGCVDLVLTDPPYEIGTGGSGNSCLTSISKVRTGLNHLAEGYDHEAWFEQIRRVSKLVNCFIFCSNRQISKTMLMGEMHGFSTTLLVWHKYNSVPFSNGVWRSDIEYVVHIRQSGATFNGNAAQKQKVSRYPIEQSKYGHPTEKPLELIRKYVRIGSNPGDLILDTFMGSGTTAQAALEEGRHFIGYELDPDYYAAATKRIEQYRSQLKLFA